MARLTRSNIAYDLSISPHRLQMVYAGEPLTYVFSSELYMKKFIEKCEENREEIERSLSKRFGVNVKNPILADLRLYSTIEKRGFLLVKDEVKIECKEHLTLDGARVISTSSAG